VIYLRNLINPILKYSCAPARFGKGIIVPLVKYHTEDVCSIDNYRGTTVSSVFSKTFECCLLSKCEHYLYSNKLQFGFKKQRNCGPPIHIFQQVVNYFRNSQVYISAVDASKAVDRVHHKPLFDKVGMRTLPDCVIGVFKNCIVNCVP